MPRKPQPWFRMYVEIFSDRKIRRLTPAERWVVAGVFGAARESHEPGRLYIAEGVPMTTRDLADYTDVPMRTVTSALTKMTELGIVSTDPGGLITVTNFAHRQYESDNVTARTRTHRERSKERSNDDPPNVPKNDVGTDVGTTPSRARATETETETENRTREVTTAGEQRPETLPPPNATDHPPNTPHDRYRCTAHQGVTNPPPCMGCKTARERAEAEDARTDDRERERRLRELEQLRANCPDCEGTGFVLDTDKNPTRKCTHPNARRTA